MKTLWIVALATVLVLVAVPLSAQPITSAKSGTVSWVQGKVFLGDEPVEQSLTKFPDIKENVVLRTELGRAEILLTPGVVMHVGENSSFRMISKRLIDTRLEIMSGSAVISAVEMPKDNNIAIVCKGATVMLSKAGHYRLDADNGLVKVHAGLAMVEREGERAEVSAGKMLNLSTTAALEKFDKNEADSLDNWARQRDQLMAMANVSTARSMYNGYGYGYGSYGSYGGSMWGWNPYLGIYTYIPGSGRLCDPFYGYCYWSPATVGRVYYQPPAPVFNGGGFGGGGAGYPSMGSTSGGYSGTMASSSGSVGSSAPAAAASSGSSAASAGSSGSVGHGGGGGGGRGH